jgi:hypothetical protein
MKTNILNLALPMILLFSLHAFADEPSHHLITINAAVAKAAAASYAQGFYRFIQNGKLIESSDVDDATPLCMLEAGKFEFNPELSYELESMRNLDPDTETGEIELNFKTQSADPDAYFQIYCFQATAGANLDTAREGLKTVFEIK